MSIRDLPKFPYGAVYFRKSNPPCEDWEQDYQTAAEDGMNTFATGSCGRRSRLLLAFMTGRNMTGSWNWRHRTG